MRHTNNKISNFYSGLSGLVLPTPKYLFPEEHQNSSRLTYYATFFNSIEINSTFYKLPQAKTITNWVAQVPEYFKFTCKLSKEITHAKGLNFNEGEVELFFKTVAAVGSKKGCILVQFPPSLGSIRIKQLEALLRCILKNNTSQEWRIAVEFRNQSWYTAESYDLLHTYDVALVQQDIPKSKSPMMTHTANFVYARFHGPNGNYKDSYSDAFLSEYSTFVRDWFEDGKTVYAYFNNTMGDAFLNLQTFNKFLY